MPHLTNLREFWEKRQTEAGVGGALSATRREQREPREPITTAVKPILASKVPVANIDRPQNIDFLDLPLEIREIIYQYAFSQGGPIKLYAASGGSMYMMGGTIGLDLRLLFTCRQVYAEATQVMYNSLEFDFFGDTMPHIRKNRELHMFKKADTAKVQREGTKRSAFATIVLPLTDIRNIKICAHWVQLYNADTSLEFIKWFPSLRNLTCVIAARDLSDERWENVVRLITLVPEHIHLDIERSYSFLGTAYPAKEVWLALKQRTPSSKFVKDLDRWEDPTVAESESRKAWPAPFFQDPATRKSSSPKWAR